MFTIHTTVGAVIEVQVPEGAENWQQADIFKWAWANWQQGAEAVMHGVMNAVQDPRDWRNPFLAIEPVDGQGRNMAQWVHAAAVWFHGNGETTIRGNDVHAPGYAAW